MPSASLEDAILLILKRLDDVNCIPKTAEKSFFLLKVDYILVATQIYLFIIF